MIETPLAEVLKLPGGKELISAIFDLILRQKIAHFMAPHSLRPSLPAQFNPLINEKLEALQRLMREPLPTCDLKQEVIHFCLEIIARET